MAYHDVMKKSQLLLFGSLLSLTLMAPLAGLPASAASRYEVAGLENQAAVDQFFGQFQQAVAKGDRATVAAMIHYPISVKLGGKAVQLKTKAELISRFDSVFPAAFKRKLAGIKVKDLWANYQGVATPGGELWLGGVIHDQKHPEKYELRVIAINN